VFWGVFWLFCTFLCRELSCERRCCLAAESVGKFSNGFRVLPLVADHESRTFVFARDLIFCESRSPFYSLSTGATYSLLFVPIQRKRPLLTPPSFLKLAISPSPFMPQRTRSQTSACRTSSDTCPQPLPLHSAELPSFRCGFLVRVVPYSLTSLPCLYFIALTHSVLSFSYHPRPRCFLSSYFSSCLRLLTFFESIWSLFGSP